MNKEMQSIYNELQEIAEDLELNSMSEFDSYMNADTFNELDDELDGEYNIVSLDQMIDKSSDGDFFEAEDICEEELSF